LQNKRAKIRAKKQGKGKGKTTNYCFPEFKKFIGFKN